MLFSLILAATAAHAGDVCRVTPDCESPLVCIRRKCVDKPALTEAPARTATTPGAPHARLKWHPDDPVPAGAHVEQRPIKSLWVSGLIVDLAAWALRGTFTGLACANTLPCTGAQIAGAFIPVIGAWVSLPDTSDSTAAGALVFSGIVEAGGFAMLVLGFVLHHDVLIWDDGTTALRLLPLTTPSATGLSLSGHF